MSTPVYLILLPGTRIVTRNDANRVGGGPLLPAGAGAVITDSPSDAQHAYKVRCNDGAEAMLRRTEFSILKEFKAAGSEFKAWQPFVSEIKWTHAMHLLRLLLSGISAL